MGSKKIIPLSILFGMFLMLLLSWNNVLSYHTNKSAEYDQHIEAAEKYMEKKIYIDAVNEYKKALKIKPDNYELAMQIADIYQELDDKQSYLSACNSAIVADRTKLDPYLILADYYFEVNNYTEAYRILSQAKIHIDDSKITDRIAKIKGNYRLSALQYDAISAFHYEKGKSTGYAPVLLEDSWGLVSTANKITVKCEYDDIGLYSEDVIPVKKDGEYYYITVNGYRKLVPDTPMDYVGTFNNGYAPAEKSGVWGYINKKMKEFHFEYEFAGCFYNGIAAVKKNGKWGIINTDFKMVHNFDFDDILTDDYGFCSVYGVFWAKRDGQYYLYNTAGECISEGFEEVKPFASNEPAAAKKSGKWCYVSKAGEIVLETEYKDIDSFSLGYAPYLENGKWGCIDENGDVLIEPTFDAMQPFARNGYALVEVDGIQKFAVVSIYD